MQDAFLGRVWADHHERFSKDVGRGLDAVGARLRWSRADPLPLVGHAIALALAVSLASLSVGATLA